MQGKANDECGKAETQEAAGETDQEAFVDGIAYEDAGARAESEAQAYALLILSPEFQKG